MKLLHDCGLHPSLIAEFSREAMASLATRDGLRFRLACGYFIDGKYDETLICVLALALAGWMWELPNAQAIFVALMAFGLFRAVVKRK